MVTAASETVPFRGLGTGLSPLLSFYNQYKTEETISLVLPFTLIPKVLHLDEKHVPESSGKYLHMPPVLVLGIGAPNKPGQADIPQESTWHSLKCWEREGEQTLIL